MSFAKESRLWKLGLMLLFSPLFDLSAGGAERDPGGAEEPAAESAGLRRRKDLSTSGWLGDRTREILRFAQNDNSKEGGQAPF